MQIASIAIIEDDDKIRHYLAEQVRMHIDVERLETFADAESALQQLSVYPVELAMFDVELPGMNGIECMRRLKVIHPRMQGMMLTVYDNSDTNFEALKAGASSYILKNTPPEKIMEAVPFPL